MNDFEKFKLEHEKRKEKKLKKAKTAIAGTLAAAIISSGMAIGAAVLIDDEKDNPKTPKNIKEDYVSVDKSYSPNSEIKTITLPGNNETKYSPSEISLQSYGATSYYTMSEDYAIKTAKKSMERVEKTLKENVPNITPIASNTGNFYPDYYDEYMLAGLSFTESNYRICTESGTPLTSKDGALGPMQILPETVEYVNYWLSDVMEIDGIKFTTKDLTDPEKAMDIANYYIISCCKNYGKEGCNNPVFEMMGEKFSVSRQQEIIIAMYNEGPKNMITHAKDGTIKAYLKEGSSGNYLNKVLKNSENLREKYASNYK